MMNIKCDIETFVEKPSDTSKTAILRQAKEIEIHNKKLEMAKIKSQKNAQELKNTLELT